MAVRRTYLGPATVGLALSVARLSCNVTTHRFGAAAGTGVTGINLSLTDAAGNALEQAEREDDPALRALIPDMLGSLAPRVTVYSDAPGALAELCPQPAHYDLLFTDETMPELSGGPLPGPTAVRASRTSGAGVHISRPHQRFATLSGSERLCLCCA